MELVGDANAMAATPSDVKEYPNSYMFIVDMPRMKSSDIMVQVDNDIVLSISDERKREAEETTDGAAKYVRMERVGKFMKKFKLPENSDKEKIAAVYLDRVLTVTVEKLPPPPLPEPQKPRTIEVKIA